MLCNYDDMLSLWVYLCGQIVIGTDWVWPSKWIPYSSGGITNGDFFELYKLYHHLEKIWTVRQIHLNVGCACKKWSSSHYQIFFNSQHHIFSNSQHQIFFNISGKGSWIYMGLFLMMKKRGIQDSGVLRVDVLDDITKCLNHFLSLKKWTYKV